MGVGFMGSSESQGLFSPFLTINIMTITQDNNWYEVPTLAEKDKMKAPEEKNKTYWDKERLQKFWGTNPTQEFNDRIETQDDIQLEFQEALGGVEQPSKKIRRFPSGAVRSDDTGRIRPDYISPYALAEIAKHFTVAKNDFGATNYFRGIKPEDIVPSVSRHYLDLMEAQMNGDKDKLREEFRALAANCVMALHQIVMEEKGEYVEYYDSTELVNSEDYLQKLKQEEAIVKMMSDDEKDGLYF